MQYMIIEGFKPGKLKALYQRFDEKGRMLPEGVHYINSWIDEKISVCYQVMESDSVEKINEWISKWNDLVDFEVIPLITSDRQKRRCSDKKYFNWQHGICILCYISFGYFF